MGANTATGKRSGSLFNHKEQGILNTSKFDKLEMMAQVVEVIKKALINKFYMYGDLQVLGKKLRH